MLFQMPLRKRLKQKGVPEDKIIIRSEVSNTPRPGTIADDRNNQCTEVEINIPDPHATAH